MVAIRLILIVFALIGIYYAAKRRAPIEARKIGESDKELGLKWHVQQWLTGKLGAGLLAVLPFALTFQSWHILISGAAMGLTAMAWYSYIFDQHTALTDKFLREVMWRMKWTPEQTHNRVKLPLLFVGLVACVVVALW